MAESSPFCISSSGKSHDLSGRASKEKHGAADFAGQTYKKDTPVVVVVTVVVVVVAFV